MGFIPNYILFVCIQNMLDLAHCNNPLLYQKIVVCDRKHAGMSNVWISDVLMYRKIHMLAGLVPMMYVVWERGWRAPIEGWGLVCIK